MKRILLVAPLPLRFDLTQDQAYLKLPFSKVSSFLMPLHIATVAGLTPDDYHVDLWDESVQGLVETKPDASSYDLVGITGYTVHLPRAHEVAKYFRSLSILVAIGGPGISSAPQNHYDDFDILFLGEAELTWPQFLEDWENGNYQKKYRQVKPLDLSLTTPPDWDSVAHLKDHYLVGAVQTSRGCPFDCEFCDVSYLFGLGYRHKPVETVVEEVTNLQKIGVRRIVFCDDNFYGNRSFAKELLKRLIEFNRTLEHPLAFASEATINIANSEDILQLLADANFVEIFVGIESPNKESLKETNKPQNFRSNLVHDIRKIQSYGMAVRGSLIVGFDQDDKGIFEEQFEFVQDAHLVVPSIRVLMAPPGTRLWQRMKDDGRLLKGNREGRYYGNPGTTNLLPKNMTRTELHAGYLELIEKIYSWENFAIRIKGFISSVKNEPNVPKQKIEWDRLFQFYYFLLFSLDSMARKVVWGIIKHTRKNAPFLMARVMRIIMRQYGYSSRPKLRASIQQQIDLEESGEFVLEIEQEKTLLSREFKESYEEFFPTVYGSVVDSLIDKIDIEFILMRIFKEFIVSKGKDIGALSEQDKSQLLEIAEAVVTDSNLKSDRRADSLITDAAEIEDPRYLRMFEQVLKAVEQELRIDKTMNKDDSMPADIAEVYIPVADVGIHSAIEVKH